MKLERANFSKFLKCVNFLKSNFKDDTLDRLSNELKLRFLTTKDCLYKKGDEIDGIYIIKSGLLIKYLIV